MTPPTEARAMRDCPRWDTCSVPLCPLDVDWRLRAVMPSEAVCPYLLELDKPGDPVARFAGRYDAFVIEAAVRLRDALTREAHPRYAFLPARIAKAAATPTMIEQAAANAARLASARAARKQVDVPSPTSNPQGEPAAEVSGHVPDPSATVRP